MASGSNTSTTTSGPPPQVMQEYENLIKQSNAVGQTPLRQYSGNMVQGFAPMEQQAFQGVENAQGVADPYINAASQYASSAATPIYVPGGFTNGGLSNLVNNGLGYSNQAANTNIGAAGAPGVGTAFGGIQNAYGAAQMGAPKNYAGNISQYMSPYTQDVVNATEAQFNNQNAQQNQGIVGNAISSGAWGGDRASVAQGIAAGQEALSQAPVIAGLENQGYTNAQSQLNQQQQLGLQAGSLAASTGIQAGNLGQQAASQQAALQNQAAQMRLGLYSGQQQAGIGAQEASGWLGSNAANTLGALGQQAQSSALTNANALYSMGSQQQQLGQEQLNIPYEQFQQQQAYPFQIAQWEANIGEGIGGASGGTSSTTTPGPSVGSQVIGAGLGTAGILGATGAFGSNGYLSNWFGGGGGGAAAGNGISFARGGRAKPKGFAAGGVPLNDGIEDPSISFIPVASGGGTSQINSMLHMPQTTQTVSQDPGLGGILGDVLTVAKIASLARGGAIPNGFAPGGSANNSDVAGSIMGSRGISIPQLVAAGGQSPNVDPSLLKDYAPPPVSSSPYTSTTFPVLNGGKGAPSTVSITPVKGADGNWTVPASQLPKATTPTIGTTTEDQIYQQLLHRTPDASGAAYYANMSPAEIRQSIMQSPEYLNDQSTDYGANSGSPSAGAAGFGGFGVPGITRALGGRAQGFRPHFDLGGQAEYQAGAVASGAPIGGGNPMAQGMYADLSKLSPEKLQELAQRMPSGSMQGQLVRRALQMSHVNPQAATMASMQPQMARGGRTALADGGDPEVFDDLNSDPEHPFDAVPPTGFSPPASAQQPSIFDAVAGRSNGFSPVKTPVSGALTQKPLHTASGFAPRPAPALDPGEATSADIVMPSVTVDHGSDDVRDQPKEQTFGQKFASSPWLALAATGAGMLASRDSHPGVALGEGLESGLRVVGQQQTEADKKQALDNEAMWRGKDLTLKAQQISNDLQDHKDTIALQTKRDADLAQHEQDESKHWGAMEGIEGENAGAHLIEANRGDWQPIRNLTTPDGKPVLDANGVPQGILRNQYTGETKQGPATDPALMRGRGSGGMTMELANQLVASGGAPDLTTALSKIHDPSGHYAAQIEQARRTLAQSAARADPEYQADPVGTVQKWNDEYGATPLATARPAATPAGSAPAAPNAASVSDIPAPADRKIGHVYPTPKGPLAWTGTGWLPAPPSGN